MSQAYPLQWPIQRPRTPAAKRKRGVFSAKGRPITLAEATSRLAAELRRIEAPDWNWIVSTNLELRKSDGMPKSGQPQPRDPGVAVYFRQKDDRPICLPCDTYSTIEQNVAAIANHIAATRAIERYGVASIAEMFTGFVAIADRPHWTSVLGVGADCSRAGIELAYRRLARERHPDAPGGSHNMMADLNRAREDAHREAKS